MGPDSSDGRPHAERQEGGDACAGVELWTPGVAGRTGGRGPGQGLSQSPQEASLPTSGLQNGENTISGLGSHPACGPVIWQPQDSRSGQGTREAVSASDVGVSLTGGSEGRIHRRGPCLFPTAEGPGLGGLGRAACPVGLRCMQGCKVPRSGVPAGLATAPGTRLHPVPPWGPPAGSAPEAPSTVWAKLGSCFSSEPGPEQGEGPAGGRGPGVPQLTSLPPPHAHGRARG